MTPSHLLKVAIAQMSPVWLDKKRTLEKIYDSIETAGKQSCELMVFGEALLPGYPFWIELTDGAKFNSLVQKELHAHYIRQAVEIEKGDLDVLCELAKKHELAIYLGTIERAMNRGGHSVYCSLVYINQEGSIQSVHRKLQPTYEERLSWAPGDGHGLQVHPLKEFTVGGLNCWENWMPLSRTALYGQGENLHIAVWPGNEKNTFDITKFMAKEGRSFVISASGLMKKSDIPEDTPHYDQIIRSAPEIMANGASCIAGPDGEWVVPPVLNEEKLIVANLDFNRVLEERQNFDVSGHYSRPDVTQLTVNRERQSILKKD
ncbi:carbon-nitrogen hydrolase family protein [Reichenbachiella sp.]